MQKLYITVIAMLLLISSCKSVQPEEKMDYSFLDNSRELIVVTTPDWNSKFGTLQRYEKIDNRWVMVGEPIEVVIGRNGLGWGLGLHTIPENAKYIKREGDGRSPAGVFSLKNGFGYGDLNITYPYEVYNNRYYHCVDDSNSKYYNKIVDSREVQKDYKSFEHMKLDTIEYKYGVVVNHNPEAKPMGGSCIFIHIKRDDSGTSGCTAMDEDKMLEILKWLKKDKNPLLIQLPKEEMKKRFSFLG
jgi:D-alanyl-D-alanine dipeptidase